MMSIPGGGSMVGFTQGPTVADRRGTVFVDLVRADGARVCVTISPVQSGLPALVRTPLGDLSYREVRGVPEAAAVPIVRALAQRVASGGYASAFPHLASAIPLESSAPDAVPLSVESVATLLAPMVSLGGDALAGYRLEGIDASSDGVLLHFAPAKAQDRAPEGGLPSSEAASATLCLSRSLDGFPVGVGLALSVRVEREQGGHDLISGAVASLCSQVCDLLRRRGAGARLGELLYTPPVAVAPGPPIEAAHPGQSAEPGRPPGEQSMADEVRADRSSARDEGAQGRPVVPLRDRLNFAGRSVLIAVMLVAGGKELWEILHHLRTEWYWLVLAVVYSTVINDIFCHRICSHGMFAVDTRTLTYKVLTWLASADLGYGPVRALTLMHNLHHIHSDRGPWDNMNWRYHWYSTTTVSPIPPLVDSIPDNWDAYASEQQARYGYILDDPLTSWCFRRAAEISLVTLVALYLLAPVLLFKVLLPGRVLLTVMTGLAGTFGHMKHFPLSYRNQDTPDTTSNSLVLHYLFLGLFAGMLQNNHHAYPRAESPNPRRFELDTSWPFVRILRHLLERRGPSAPSPVPSFDRPST